MTQLREPVVLVHGLWMNGFEFGVLRHRLQARHGFDVHVFPYSSVHGDANAVADELAQFALRCAASAEAVHLVGHSLGGAFVYRAAARALRERPGRAVLLGAPLNGSRAAASVARLGVLRPLLGNHVFDELVAPQERRWPAGNTTRALGAIAGSRRVGLGQFFAHFGAEENDGTIAVAETVIPGLDDHLVLPHSHMGLLFANDTADQVAHFLRHARFRRDAER